MVQDNTTTASPTAPPTKKLKTIPENTSNQDEIFTTALQNIEESEHQINTIEDEQSLEICQLEQKYVAKKLPLYEARQEFINKIENFWSIAILNHSSLSCLITEEDEKALKFLDFIEVDQKSRDVEDKDEETGETIRMKSLNFVIKFHFKDGNPYFENKVLSKSFYQVMDEVVSEGDEIKWKGEDKNLIELARKIKVDQVGSKEEDKEMGDGDNNDENNPENDPENENEEPLTLESFFLWFEDHEDAENDETANDIKEDLWLRALHYYSGKDNLDEEGSEVNLEGDAIEEVGAIVEG